MTWWQTGFGVILDLESGVVAENWRSAVIVPLYKGKGERTECKLYRY